MAMLRANVEKMPNKSHIKKVAQGVTNSKVNQYNQINTSNPFLQNLKKDSENLYKDKHSFSNKSDPYKELFAGSLN